MGHIFDLSNRNSALSPSTWAVSRDVAWPDIIRASLSQTCHSHRVGFTAVSFTSSRCERGAFAIQRICAPPVPFSSPEVRHNQTDPLPSGYANRSGNLEQLLNDARAVRIAVESTGSSEPQVRSCPQSGNNLKATPWRARSIRTPGLPTGRKPPLGSKSFVRHSPGTLGKAFPGAPDRS